MKKYTRISELNNINSLTELYATITIEYNSNDKKHDRVFDVIKKLNLDKFGDSQKCVFLSRIVSYYLCENTYDNPDYYKFLLKPLSFEMVKYHIISSSKEASHNTLKYGLGILKTKVSNDYERSIVENLYKEK